MKEMQRLAKKRIQESQINGYHFLTMFFENPMTTSYPDLAIQRGHWSEAG